jgi:hypothetical protein
MHDLKQATMSYFQDLKYIVTSKSDEVYDVKQKRTGLEVELDFSIYGKGELPANTQLNKDKRLIFINVCDVEKIGFDETENFCQTLNRHCSLIVLDDDYFEQTMKDIWMFLSIDPRDRNAFTDSRFYKA